MARLAFALFLLAVVAQASWLKFPSIALRFSESFGGGRLPAPEDVQKPQRPEMTKQAAEQFARNFGAALDRSSSSSSSESDSSSSSESEEEMDKVNVASSEFNQDFVKLPGPHEFKSKQELPNMLKESHEEHHVIEVDSASEEAEEVFDEEFDRRQVKITPVRRGLLRQPKEQARLIEEEWFKDSKNMKGGCLKRSGKNFESKTAPREWELGTFNSNELPKAFDWRNVNGTNFCSPTRNQHIPVYCGSCWVFGTTGMLNDRFNVARKNRWPMTMVSPQEVIDCNGKGNCQGGEPGNVLEHAKLQGLVEEGCNVYRAVNGECTPFHRCGTCWPESCEQITNYTRYYIKDYGKVTGREAIMTEVLRGGPVACSITCTPRFDFNYTGGIYEEKGDPKAEPNHIVTLSGWGVEEKTGEEYWIVRNSWGEAWGERGWYRVVTSKYLNGTGNYYNMGIENECYYADVDVSNLN